MKKQKLTIILKYLPYVLAGLLFFVGRCSTPKPDKDLIKKYELERKTLLEDIKLKEARIIDRETEAKEIVTRMKQDSLKTYVELQAKNRAIFKLKESYENISFRDADGAKLDSVLSVLY